MIFKELLIFITVLAFAKVQEVNDDPPRMTLDPQQTNSAIKRRLTEENTKETKSSPYLNYLNQDDTSFNERDSKSNTKNSNSTHPIQSSSMMLKKSKANIQSVKNSTVESLKKELMFDAIYIANHVEDVNEEDLSALMESHMNDVIFRKEDDFPGDIIFEEIDSEKNDNNITRRLLPDVIYQAIVPDDIKTPLDKTLLQNNPLLRMAPQNQPQKDNATDENKQPCNKDESRSADENETDDFINQLRDPAKGLGISDLIRSRMMMTRHPRVCYACSSIHDKSCWEPNRKTTVKYCRQDHQSCVSKLYKHKGVSYVLRDCDSTCSSTAISSINDGGPAYAYTMCTICHADLCNRAYFIQVQNMVIVTFVLFNLSLYFAF